MKTKINQSKHTQGELKVFAITVDNKPKKFAIGIKGEEVTIAICKRINVSDEEAEANAQRIVKAVNEYDALKEKEMMYDKAVTILRGLRGIEVWISDRKMKEMFQKKVYEFLDSLK